MKRLATLWLVLSLAALATAQERDGHTTDRLLQERDAAKERADAAWVEADWKKSLVEYRQVLKLEEQALGNEHEDSLETHKELASLILHEEGPAAARRAGSDWLRRAAALHGQRHWRSSDARDFLGLVALLEKLPAAQRQKILVADKAFLVAWWSGKAEQVVELGPSLAARWKQVAGENHFVVAGRLEMLATSQAALGRAAESAETLRQVLAIRKQVLGPDHPSTAQTLFDLGSFEQQEGNAEKAILLYQEALPIRKRALGPLHADYLSLLQHTGETLLNSGKHDQAQPLLEAALAGHEQSSGKESSEYAGALLALARTFKADGKRDRAEQSLREVLAIQERLVGKEDEVYVALQYELALLLQETSRHDLAEGLLEEAVRFAKAHADENVHRYALYSTSLAMSYYLQGKFAEAEPLYLEGVQLAEKQFGRRNPLTALRLYLVGFFYAAQQEYVKAWPYYQEALDIRRTLLPGDDPDLLNNIRVLALLYDAVGQHERAEPLLTEVVRARRKNAEAEPLLLAEDLRYLGSHYTRLNQHAQARPHFVEAAQVYARLPDLDPAFQLTWQASLAQLHFEAGDYSQAIDVYRRLVGLNAERHGPESREVAAALRNLGGMHLEMGNPSEAQEQLRRSLAMSEKLSGAKSPDSIDALLTLGRIFEESGDYAQAEPHYQRALSICLANFDADHAQTLKARRFLGTLYYHTSDLVQAETMFRKCLAASERQGHDAGLVTDLSSLGLVIYERGRIDEAQRLYRRALTIAERGYGKDAPATATVLNNLGMVCETLGQLDEAERLHERSRTIYRSTAGENHPLYAHALNNLGLCKQARGELAAAEIHFREAAEIFRTAHSSRHPKYAKAMNNVASIQLLQGHQPQAAEILAEMLEVNRHTIERTFPVLSERQQIAMLLWLRGPLDGYVSLATSPAQQDRAYRAVLSWKGAAFARQRWSRLAARHPQVAPKLKELQTVSSRLAGLALGGRQASESELNRLSELKESLERQLQAQLPTSDLAELRGQAAPSASDLARLLPEHSALVDFFEYVHYSRGEPAGKLARDRRLAAFVLRRDQPVELIRLGPVEPARKAIDEWRTTFGSPAGGTTPSPGERLKHLVWEPLAGRLAGCKLVLISPDGDLARLPFGALPGSDPAKYLLEEVTLAIVPVPQQLPGLITPDETAQAEEASLLLIGDVDYGGAAGPSAIDVTERAAIPIRAGQRWNFAPLANSFAEIASIERRFKRQFRTGQVQTLDRDLATEAAFRDDAGRHRWLHIATHGFFAPPQLKSALATAGSPDRRSVADEGQALEAYHPGLLSGVALAGANQPPQPDRDDGILTALEVAALDLNEVEMAVLSACETGLGSVAGGEGVLGLQRAFQMAGTQTTVTSLWKVPDLATSVLMQRFYENLWEKKMSKVEALREAQLFVLREGATRGISDVEGPPAEGTKQLPPFFWAAFVLSGDWR